MLNHSSDPGLSCIQIQTNTLLWRKVQLYRALMKAALSLVVEMKASLLMIWFWFDLNDLPQPLDWFKLQNHVNDSSASNILCTLCIMHYAFFRRGDMLTGTQPRFRQTNTLVQWLVIYSTFFNMSWRLADHNVIGLYVLFKMLIIQTKIR